MSKRSRKQGASSSRGPQVENYGDTVHSWSQFESAATAMRYAQLQLQMVERGSVIDWEFLGEQDLAEGFVHSFRTDAFTGPQWERLFRMSEPVYDELVRELFATYRFDAVAAQGDVGRTRIHFRLGV